MLRIDSPAGVRIPDEPFEPIVDAGYPWKQLVRAIGFAGVIYYGIRLVWHVDSLARSAGVLASPGLGTRSMDGYLLYEIFYVLVALAGLLFSVGCIRLLPACRMGMICTAAGGIGQVGLELFHNIALMWQRGIVSGMRFLLFIMVMEIATSAVIPCILLYLFTRPMMKQSLSSPDGSEP